MTDPDKPVVFIDSNVLIEALIASDPAVAVLDLAVAGAIKLVTSELVVHDVEEEILSHHASNPEKMDAVIYAWRTMIERTKLAVRADPSSAVVLDARQKYLPTMRHLADLPVLAAAIEAKADVIVSGNRKHFNDKTAERAGIPMYSCAEFLAKIAKP